MPLRPILHVTHPRLQRKLGPREFPPDVRGMIELGYKSEFENGRTDGRSLGALDHILQDAIIGVVLHYERVRSPGHDHDDEVPHSVQLQTTCGFGPFGFDQIDPQPLLIRRKIEHSQFGPSRHERRHVSMPDQVDDLDLRPEVLDFKLGEVLENRSRSPRPDNSALGIGAVLMKPQKRISWIVPLDLGTVQDDPRREGSGLASRLPRNGLW